MPLAGIVCLDPVTGLCCFRFAFTTLTWRYDPLRSTAAWGKLCMRLARHATAFAQSPSNMQPLYATSRPCLSEAASASLLLASQIGAVAYDMGSRLPCAGQLNWRQEHLPRGSGSDRPRHERYVPQRWLAASVSGGSLHATISSALARCASQQRSEGPKGQLWRSPTCFSGPVTHSGAFDYCCTAWRCRFF